MAYSLRSGDIVALNSGKPTMTRSVPLYAFAGELDPLTLWKTQPAIRTVIDFLAHTQAGIPLNLYRAIGENDRERVRDGSTARALKRPARGVTAFNLRRNLLIERHVYDRWVVFKNYTTEGRLELVHVPAALTTLVTSTLGQPEAIRVGFPTGAGHYDIPLNEVIYDIGYTPEIGGTLATGHSTLYTLRDLADEMRSSGEYRRDLWKNGAQIPAIITRPANAASKGWGDPERQRFLADVAKYRAGGGKEGGLPLFEDGMDIKKVEVFSPSETQYIEVRKLALAEAASAFRVPPELVGAREGNYSNVDAYREQLYQDVLGPHIMAFEQAFDLGLEDELADDEYVEANVDVKLRASFAERTKAIQSSVGAPYRTRNEARAMDNLPAIDGGDELVTPLNVLIGGMASPNDTDPTATRYDAPGGGEGDPKAQRPPHPATGTKRPDDLATTAREREALTADLARFWDSQAARLYAALTREKAARKALPAIDELLDWDAERARLEQILRGRSQRIAEAAAWEILIAYNPDAEGWSPDVMAAWLAKAAESNSDDWHVSLQNRVLSLLAGGDWEAESEGIDGWKIAAVFAIGWCTQYASFGRHDAARASGLGTKRWRTTSKNPRATHAALNGETVRRDDIFGNGLRYPGDPAGGAAEVANCSCVVDYER